MGKITVFANQKGGVGKTTTTLNLGAYLADAGKRVLLVDFDPQGNLSSGVGADVKGAGIYEAIIGAVSVQDIIQQTPVENLSVAPSTINLSGAGLELNNVENREYVLKKTLAPIVSEFDYIYIDCPPSLGLLTLNGIAAADSVIIPLQCEYYALEGLGLLIKTIRRVQKRINPALKLEGIVFTMYDSRTRLANEVMEEVTKHFPNDVFKTVIPRNVRLSEAPSHGVPINLYNAVCVGAKSYQSLSEEVLSRD